MRFSTFTKMEFLTRILSHAAALILFALMVLTTADVVGRYFFNAPILGVFEITEFMMVCIVFFSMAPTQAQKGHVAVDILVSLFSKRLQNVFEFLNYFLSMGILTLVTWKSIARGFEVMGTGEFSGTLRIPVYPFVFMLALGCAALCVEFLKDLSGKLRGDPPK